jgi:hypothetical protein
MGRRRGGGSAYDYMTYQEAATSSKAFGVTALSPNPKPSKAAATEALRHADAA